MTANHENSKTTPSQIREAAITQLLSEIIDSGDRHRDLESARRLVSRFGTGSALVGACLSRPSFINDIEADFGLHLTRALRLAALLNDHTGLVTLPAELNRIDALVEPKEPLLMAIRPDSQGSELTFSIGATLSALSPVGGYVARLNQENPGAWWVVYAKPHGSPSIAERMGAIRFLKAAQWVGIRIQRFIVRTRDGAWEVFQDSAVDDVTGESS